MRKKLSKPLIGFVTAASLLFPISVHADSYIRLDGKIIDGRTYLPLRSAGEQIKAQVGWNSKTRSATITKDGKTLTAKVGKEAPVRWKNLYSTSTT